MTRILKIALPIIVILLLFALVPSVAAQGDGEPDPADVLLPEHISDFYGIGAITNIILVMLGAGTAFLQTYINKIANLLGLNISPGLNAFLAFVGVAAVVVMALALNVFVPQDTAEQYTAQYQFVRTVIVGLAVLFGNQGMYVWKLRGVQKERAA